MKPWRMAVIAVHPVQYHTPLYRAMSQSRALDIVVLYLRHHGIDVLTDSGAPKPVIWKQDLLSGYQHEFVRNIDLSPHRGFFSRINPALFGRLFSGRYDVVLIQGYSLLSNWIALLAAKLSGTKVIWRGEVVLRSGETQTKTKKWLKRTIAGLFVKRCDAVLYSCSGNREFLEEIGISPEMLYPFPCAVDNKFMLENQRRFIPVREETRAALDIPLDHFVVVYCGRLTRGKRIVDLLDSVRLIGDNKITVLLVGDGPQRPELEGFAATHSVGTRFVGFVDQTELGRYYTIADLFVLLSEHDRSPKTLNEAMNFSLPVIVTNVCGTAADLVVDGENGFLVDVGDVRTVADKIELLASDAILRAEMGKRSAEMVKPFNFEADVKGIEDACRNIIRPAAMKS